MKFLNSDLRHFFKYVCGGVLSALIDICVLQTCIAMGFSTTGALSLGFFSGLIANYLYHSRLTFKSKSPVGDMFKFSVVVALNYTITLAFVFVSNSVLHFGVLSGKIFSLPVIAIIGFMLSKYWVFK